MILLNLWGGGSQVTELTQAGSGPGGNSPDSGHRSSMLLSASSFLELLFCNLKWKDLRRKCSAAEEWIPVSLFTKHFDGCVNGCQSTLCSIFDVHYGCAIVLETAKFSWRLVKKIPENKLTCPAYQMSHFDPHKNPKTKMQITLGRYCDCNFPHLVILVFWGPWYLRTCVADTSLPGGHIVIFPEPVSSTICLLPFKECPIWSPEHLTFIRTFKP